jgi:hypothetical protein
LYKVELIFSSGVEPPLPERLDEESRDSKQPN